MADTVLSALFRMSTRAPGAHVACLRCRCLLVSPVSEPTRPCGSWRWPLGCGCRDVSPAQRDLLHSRAMPSLLFGVAVGCCGSRGPRTSRAASRVDGALCHSRPFCAQLLQDLALRPRLWPLLRLSPPASCPGAVRTVSPALARVQSENSHQDDHLGHQETHCGGAQIDLKSHTSDDSTTVPIAQNCPSL